jgi:hypothetical protein
VSRGLLRELIIRAVGELVSAGKGKGSSFVAAFSCLARLHSGLPPERSHISAEEAKYKLWLGKGRHGKALLGLLQAGFISQPSAPPSDLISLAIFPHSEFRVSSL